MKGSYQVVAKFDGEHSSGSSANTSFSVTDGTAGAAAVASFSAVAIAIMAWRKKGTRTGQDSRSGFSEAKAAQV